MLKKFSNNFPKESSRKKKHKKLNKKSKVVLKETKEEIRKGIPIDWFIFIWDLSNSKATPEETLKQIYGRNFQMNNRNSFCKKLQEGLLKVKKKRPEGIL